MKAGDRLHLSDGTLAVVESNDHRDAPTGRPFTTYNFEVRRRHTYFVAPKGSSSCTPAVWVHNIDCNPTVDGFDPYLQLDELHRPRGVVAILRPGMPDGSDVPGGIIPPGMDSHSRRIWDLNRAHLRGKALGGDGTDRRNVIAMHEYANQDVMSPLEMLAQGAVGKGSTVEYLVEPQYRGRELMARGVTLDARSSDGHGMYVTVLNRPESTRIVLRPGQTLEEFRTEQREALKSAW